MTNFNETPPDVPLVSGGQGRADKDAEHSATMLMIVGWCLTAIAVVICYAALAAWIGG